jgi:hypothetical protein
MFILVNHCWCSDSNLGGHYNARCILNLSRIESEDHFKEDWGNLIEKTQDSFRLKSEVTEWLETNIPKGKWAVGTDKYNAIDKLNFNIFFQSSRDARKFVKKWSVFEKPLLYFNYFTEVRKRFKKPK